MEKKYLVSPLMPASRERKRESLKSGAESWKSVG